MDRSQARMIFAGANAFFGILFLLMPRLALRLYGLDPDEDRTAGLALRYFGARCLMLAAMLADEDTAEAALRQLPAVAAFDGFACTAALVTGEVPKRAALMAGVSSAVTIAIGLQARE